MQLVKTEEGGPKKKSKGETRKRGRMRSKKHVELMERLQDESPRCCGKSRGGETKKRTKKKSESARSTRHASNR